jgi:TRAP-type C4-dicarboxylate transport system permease small subunit
MIQSIEKILDKILSFLAFICILVFCTTVMLQVICRSFTFLPILSWTEELARYCFIYAVAFAGGIAVRTNAYVAVDIFTNLIPKRFKRAYAIGLNSLLCAFAVFFEIKSAFKFAFMKGRFVSTALEIPMQYVFFSMVVLFGMLAVMYFLEVLGLLTGANVKEGVVQ